MAQEDGARGLESEDADVVQEQEAGENDLGDELEELVGPAHPDADRDVLRGPGQEHRPFTVRWP